MGAGRHILRLGLVLALLAGSARPLAAAELRLSIDRVRLSQDDEAYVTVSLEGEFSDYQAPSGDCYELSTPSQSTRMSVVNGRVSRSAELQYRLTPTKPGSCVVGPAKVRTPKGWQATNSVQITVARSAEAPRISATEAQAIQAQADEPFFVRPIVPVRALYPGEPFVLGYDLWVRADVQVSDAGAAAEPALPGFLSEDLLGGKRPKGHREAVGRTTYVVYPLVRLLATPLQAGQTEIGALEAQVVTGDVFRARRFKTRSPIVTLVVKPLPEQDRPATFDAGSIGRFSLAGAVDKTRVALGEALVYTLTLQGTGNLERMNAPPFPTVDGLNAASLPSGADDQVLKDLEGMHGVRRFQYVLRPTREGRVAVPPVRWAVFDPEAARYVQLETAPTALDVTAALPTAANGSATAQAAPASAAPDDDKPLPLAEDAGLVEAAAADAGPERALPLAALGLLGLAVLGLEVRYRARRHRDTHRADYARDGALGQARRALQAARGDDARAARALHEAVDAFLAARLGVEPGRLALAELELAVTRRGVPAEQARDLRGLLESLEQAAYLPGGAATLPALRERALTLLAEVDREGR